MFNKLPSIYHFIRYKNLSRLTHKSLLTKSRACFCTGGNFDESSQTNRGTRDHLKQGPGLEHFIHNSSKPKIKTLSNLQIPYLSNDLYKAEAQKVYFEIYGCQMNVNDTEVIWSILQSHGYTKTEDRTDADIILLITCAIREGAETKVWNKLKFLKNLKSSRAKDKRKPPLKIGVLGCMAERLKEKLVEREKAVDVVAGPDSYRDLPRLLAVTQDHQTAINVMLSMDETYADIIPVRLNQNSVSVFVFDTFYISPTPANLIAIDFISILIHVMEHRSIMRGCDNMCTYCIVPFTRGRERSRPISSILDEIRYLSDQGVKEVTLLGQNVNSYRDMSEIQHSIPSETQLAKGFRTVYKPKVGGVRFADLLDKVSSINPEMRIRFTSPHPKDFPDDVLHLIQERNNICRNLHLPAQSGSTSVLERMRRGYTREAYLELVEHVKQLVPGVALSSDFICGFCGETEQEFAETLSLMRQVKFNVAFLFPYSLREKTTAHRRFKDDVRQEDKIRRLEEMVAVFRSEAGKLNEAQIGSKQLILVEGISKRSNLHLAGRNDANIKVIFPTGEIPTSKTSNQLDIVKPGDYITVQVNAANSQVLKGIPLYHSSISEYSKETEHLATNNNLSVCSI